MTATRTARGTRRLSRRTAAGARRIEAGARRAATRSNGTKPNGARPAASRPIAKVGSGAKRAAAKPRGRTRASEEYLLRLYVAGQTPKSLAAFANLKRICDEHLAGRYQIEVVDLLTNPALARGDQILALPAVVRQLPPPVKKIIGDFTIAERVLVGLDLRPMPRARRTR